MGTNNATQVVTGSKTTSNLSDGVVYGSVFIPDIFFHDKPPQDHHFLHMIETAFGKDGTDFWQKLLMVCKETHNVKKPFVHAFTEYHWYYLKNWLKTKETDDEVKKNLKESREKCFLPNKKTGEDAVNACSMKFPYGRGLEIKRMIFTSIDTPNKKPKVETYFFEDSFEDKKPDMAFYKKVNSEDCKNALKTLIFMKLKDVIKNKYKDFRTVEEKDITVTRSGEPYIFYLGDPYGLDEDIKLNQIVNFCHKFKAEKEPCCPF